MTTIVNDVSDVGIYNIVADQGTTFIRQIVYKNSAGTAINLGTGATAQMKARKSYPATLKNAAYRDPASIFIGSEEQSAYTLPVTITIASTAIFTSSNHGFVTNDVVRFTTTGALPTGLTVGTSYYVIRLTENTFNISLTPDGNAISTSGTQSGSHSVFPPLYNQALTVQSPANIFTVTIASPGVFTLNDHGFLTNDIVRITTDGVLPTGLTAGASYYVIRLNANTFNLSLTASGAAINTSGSQSGAHKVEIVRDGVIDIKIPSTTMSAVSAGIYDYDLEVTLGTSPGVGTAGDVIKIIRGLFEVRQEITY